MLPTPTFKRVRPSSEKELHSLIQRDLDSLEEGLELLQYEFGTGKGEPDFLCKDSGGCIVIIEVKLDEDEGVLFQALRYYDTIDKNRYAIAQAFPRKNVDPNQHPRIILIAGRFSDDLRSLSTLVHPTVELFEYSALATTSGEKGIHYRPVLLPKREEPPTAPSTVEDHLGYITDAGVRRLFQRAMEEISQIGPEIELYPTEGYVGFKYKGRQFANLTAQRKSFDVTAHILDEDGHLVKYDDLRISGEKDDYASILARARESYSTLVRVLRG